jgi:hypothetical protein
MTRLFRWIWRANAIVIFIAGAGVVFLLLMMLWSQFTWTSARKRAVDAAPPVGGNRPGQHLFLGRVTPVRGTGILRGELQASRAMVGFGSSSGPYSETRNLLFVDDRSYTARWLLPDDDHVVAEYADIAADSEEPKLKTPVATAAVVKPAQDDLELVEGQLLLFDPAAQRIQTVSDGVRKLQSSSLSGDNKIRLLFERHRKYVLATFDVRTFEKGEEHELSVPELK